MSAIDDYIAPFPGPVRKLLHQLKRTIQKAAPAAVETMSYGIPTFDFEGKHLVHFAGYARHIGFYPGARVGAAFEREFSKYKTGKGSVQFPLDEPLPVELVGRVVRFRMDQTLANATNVKRPATKTAKKATQKTAPKRKGAAPRRSSNR